MIVQALIAGLSPPKTPPFIKKVLIYGLSGSLR
jgi:hypothetical protein